MVRLVKPTWVSHEGGGIYTLDIQPNGRRMATGGMSNSGGIICIWNMLPIRNVACEKDPTVPKKLCQMDNHISCVNCVRFSPNGKWLASSGDDAVIMIWYLMKRGAPTTVFGSKTEFAESWRIHSQLKGHQGDILHLSWSPHSAWLASASIDNSVIVWNVSRHPPQQMAVLRGHASMVKGITWDPAGRYLASQSDDRTVRIWRTSDWGEEAQLKDPFKKSGGTTHVLRLDWSPDGSTVVAPHAINSGFPTAQIIFRQGWKPSLDFVGHRQAITCVRFNSNVFSKKFSEAAKPQNVLCVALGCKDRSLSVWMTPRRRPLLVLHDLFSGSIMDITWSQCGMELLCCSLDGSVAFLQFSSKEMGTPLSQNELVKLHRDTYGQSLLCDEDAAAITIGGVSGRELEGRADGPGAGLLAESAEMLALQREQRKKQEEAAAAAAADQGEARSKAAAQLPRGPAEQIETRVEGGRRRITPKFLGDLHGDAEPADEESGASGGPAGPVATPAPAEAAQEARPAEGGARAAGGRGRADATAPSAEPAPEAAAAPPAVSKETASPDGKIPAASPRKRGRPRKEKKEPPAAAAAAAAKPRRSRVLSSSGSSSGGRTSGGEASSESGAEGTSPTSGASSSTEAASSAPGERRGRGRRGRARRLIVESESEAEREPEEERRGRRGRRGAAREKEARADKREKGAEKKAAARSGPVLAGAPGLPTGQTSLGLGGDRSVQVDSVEVQSRTGAPMRLHRLSVWDARLNQRTAEVLLPDRPVAMATTKEHVCLCDARGRLHVWTAVCTRLCPPLRLDAGCVSMTTQGSRLLLVTRDCVAHLWSLSPAVRLLHRASFASLVDDASSYRSCQLSSDDTIVISLVDGSAFAFSPQVNVWLELADAGDSVRQLSRQLYKDTATSGPLALATATAGGRSNFFVGATPAGVEECVRQAALEDFLESQLASALLLRSPEETRHWLLGYARHIIAAGREEKVRKLCEDLLGPTHPDSAHHSSWEDNILGIRKRALLHEILPSFGLNLKLQRLFAEVKDQLDALEA